MAPVAYIRQHHPAEDQPLGPIVPDTIDLVREPRRRHEEPGGLRLGPPPGKVASMSDAGDDQDQSEALDDDNLGPGDFPPDHSLGLGELAARAVTAADAYAPDSIEERDWREEPDFDQRPIAYTEREGVAGLLEPDLVNGQDVEADLIADEAEPDDDRGGPVLSDASDLRPDSGGQPAEEAAIHLEGG